MRGGQVRLNACWRHFEFTRSRGNCVTDKLLETYEYVTACFNHNHATNEAHEAVTGKREWRGSCYDVDASG
jgi:hypothetical protein